MSSLRQGTGEMKSLRIKKARSIKGRLCPPPDKSITHRAIILSSIADGKTIVENPLLADDCMRTINAMRALGTTIEVIDGRNLRIEGRPDGLLEPEDVLDLGNSGTTMRLILGLLSGQRIYTVLTGDGSLRRRPMRRVIEPLTKMGARIFGREGGDRPPLSIIGSSPLRPIQYELIIPSAQVKGAILLAGLYADGLTQVKEQVLSRDHTERMLPMFGVNISKDGLNLSINGPTRLKSPGVIRIPGDISSAAFFIVSAILVPGSELLVEDVCLNPTRTGMIQVLRKMGARIEILNQREVDGEVVGDIFVRSSELKGITIDEKDIPVMIDEIPLIALAGSLAHGRTLIKGAKELRVKESDRISAISNGLNRLGARITELEDGLIIHGPCRLKGSIVESWGDHRIAMMLSIAGLLSEGETLIENTECIRTSYPRFEETLMGLVKD